MIGYCCIAIKPNNSKKKKDYLLVNRGMIKKTFDIKGLPYVSDLTLLNLDDCLEILKYNISENIYVYRLSSDMFPCIGFYNIKDLPKYDLISKKMIEIGNFIKDNKIRVSFHPSHFNVLASENIEVVNRTIDELNKHAELMDMMNLDMNTYYPINIHIGTTKPSTTEACIKFCNNFNMLSESCKSRLTVENDDSTNQYSVKMLYDNIYSKIGIPIVADSLHYMCNTGNMSWEETLNISVSTWITKPLAHHSSSKKIFEDVSARINAHSDFLYEKFIDFGIDIDIELECKQKDIALIRYREEFL